MNSAQESHCPLQWQATLPGRCSSGPAKSRHHQDPAGGHRHPSACRQVYQTREVVRRHLILLPNQQQSGLQSP
jgi:hypothetical protein